MVLVCGAILGVAEASGGGNYSEEVDHYKYVLVDYTRSPVLSVVSASSTKK